MKIERWLRNGEMYPDTKTTDELLENAGQILDSANVWDLLGTPVFIGEDGKTYVVNVEALIVEANPEFVTEILEEAEG